MAITTLAVALHKALPNLSLRARVIVDAAFLSGGGIGTAQQVAQSLGLSSRFALARLLKREGLPPLKDIAAWASVLTWVESAHSTGSSLCHLAFRARKDPGFCYRTVRRVTGHPWQEIRPRSAAWVLELFLSRCRPEAKAPVPTGRNPSASNARFVGSATLGIGKRAGATP